MQLNRFMWEDVEKRIWKNKRIRTVLQFENVLGGIKKHQSTNKG